MNLYTYARHCFYLLNCMVKLMKNWESELQIGFAIAFFGHNFLKQTWVQIFHIYHEVIIGYYYHVIIQSLRKCM